MRKARDWWTNKTAFVIASHTGHSVRTVRRWMAGSTIPDSDVGYALIRTDRGPAIIETIAADMTPKERAVFWREMEKVAKRQRMVAERDLLTREIEASA